MTISSLPELLRGHPYPGRGILLGRSDDGGSALLAYFIMGRSENSRNRVFESTEDGIRTRAFDEAKMTDPTLILYHPVRRVGSLTVVTNGDQTDTIRDHLQAGGSFESALRLRRFEPDGPNYTPRISGLLHPDGGYRLSILKSADGDPGGDHRFFFEYDCPRPGTGHFIHTYEENLDPLPSFRGEPRAVRLPGLGLEDWARELWENLNGENKVSLFAAQIALDTGRWETVIHNKHH